MGRDSSLFSLQNDAKLVSFIEANSTINKCFLDSGKSVQTFLQMGRSVLSLIGKKFRFRQGADRSPVSVPVIMSQCEQL